ncbi:hypothetical protein V6N12_065421 [Hibiscus sabdariffa]|uniref:Uncharacterized protein n=1 Tax=Hibiscus sabdariffa TaxID=183260 RepID=A0ABR2G9P3_9ROSI
MSLWKGLSNLKNPVPLLVFPNGGGDVLALLLFSAIGRYNHGLLIFVTDTLLTNDPFLAGWFLSAYFLGGYSEDGRGANGLLTTP